MTKGKALPAALPKVSRQKKIARLGLADITNQAQSKLPPRPRPVPITLLSGGAARMSSFLCFQEGEVFSGKVRLSDYRIAHSVDNDCDTDEEQMEGAIRLLSDGLLKVL
jgi:hypothetical protein